MASYLLKEDGGKLLQEDGFGILLESSTPPVTGRIVGGYATIGPPTLGAFLDLNTGWTLTGDN